MTRPLHPPRSPPSPRARAVAGLGACAQPPVRFADREILWRDPDDAPIPMPPPRPQLGNGRFWVGANNAIFQPAERFFNVDYGVEASNVNALDEVPDSTWWTDRRRDPRHPAAPPRALGADVLTRAAGDGEAPQAPFRITAGLAGGSTAGFVVPTRSGASGRSSSIRRSTPASSAAPTPSPRGWRGPRAGACPTTRSSRSRAAISSLAPDAKIPNQWGQKEILDDGEVDSILYHCARDAAGRYRVGASRWIDGKVARPVRLARSRRARRQRSHAAPGPPRPARLRRLGGVGRRRRHHREQHARRLRRQARQRATSSTTSSTSAAPSAPSPTRSAPFWIGDQSYFQADRIIGVALHLRLRAVTTGTTRAGSARGAPSSRTYPEIGGYSTPSTSSCASGGPSSTSRRSCGRRARDRYWGAKRVAAFSRGEIAAVVAAGAPSPGGGRATSRRRCGGAASASRATAFAESAPLDHFTRRRRAALLRRPVGALRARRRARARVYRAREERRDVGFVHGAGSDGAVCLTLPPRDGYRVVALDAARPGERHFGPTVAVHLSVRDGRARVVGVAR